MSKFSKPLTVLAALLVLLAAFVALPAVADDARADRILANLKLKFPQLDNAQLQVTMNPIEASDYEGLEIGSFNIASPQGSQTQTFLVSKDDKALYLINGEPIDVSKTSEEIQAELDKRQEAELAAAKEKHEELEKAIAGLPTRGNPDAAVTIVEFSDFQCPYCARGAESMEQILEKHEGTVKFVFKHFPLGFHPWAKPAAIASHCAAEQKASAFWTLHDKFFENQGDINPDNVIEKSKEYLADSGLDLGQWETCATNEESDAYKAAAAAVDADMELGQKLGVSGTPGFFVNGQFLNGAQPITAFEPLIKAAKENAG